MAQLFSLGIIAYDELSTQLLSGLRSASQRVEVYLASMDLGALEL